MQKDFLTKFTEEILRTEKTNGLRRFLELVAYVPHRLNEDAGGVLDLAPESPYMDINRPVATIVIVVPDFTEQSLAAEYSPLVARQKSEQFVFLEG